MTNTQRILEQNRTCADCSTVCPSWCSLTYGVVLCIRCAGIHRKIYSRVKSCTLDTWSREQVFKMEQWGNERVNEILEGALRVQVKPKAASSMLVVEDYIRNKYVEFKYCKSKMEQKQYEESCLQDKGFPAPLQRITVQTVTETKRVSWQHKLLQMLDRIEEYRTTELKEYNTYPHDKGYPLKDNGNVDHSINPYDLF